jgi:hypothetical protein
MGHDLTIIFMQNLVFIGSYGIDLNIVHIFVFFEHRCHSHCLTPNSVPICIVYTWMLYVYSCHLHMKVVHTTFVFQ